MKTVAIGSMMLGISLAAGTAAAYTINDNTLVLEGHSRSAAVADEIDVIGDLKVFQVFGIDYSTVGNQMNFDLYTNFSGKHQFATQSDGTTYNFYLADLAIDANRDGIFDYGVVLNPHSDWTEGVKPTAGDLKAGLYAVSQWDTSSHFFEENTGSSFGGIGYGEKYNTNKTPVVAVAGGSLLSELSISKIYTSSEPYYKYSFSFDKLLLQDLADGGPVIFWGGATCANDVITNQPVPEPASLLLMGSGLAGLYWVSRRKRSI